MCINLDPPIQALKQALQEWQRVARAQTKERRKEIVDERKRHPRVETIGERAAVLRAKIRPTLRQS